MDTNEPRKDKLRAIVSHIIRETPSLHALLKVRKDCPFLKFRIQINDDNQPSASKKKCYIIVGIGDFNKLYDICCCFEKTYHLDFCTSSDILKCEEEDNDFCVDDFDISEKDLDDVKLFKDNLRGSVGTLFENALAFSLYHEFGHIKYDEDYLMPIEKEKKADLFAMGIVHEKSMESPNSQLEKSPAFLGALLDLILILYVSNPKVAEEATTHPHPIERIYKFLEYFNIGNNSYLWQYVYNIVRNWSTEHHIAMTFERDSSISDKDKLLDAYLRFKK